MAALLGNADGPLQASILDDAIDGGVQVHAINFALNPDAIHLLPDIRSAARLFHILAVFEAADGHLLHVADVEISMQRLAQGKGMRSDVARNQFYAQGLAYGEFDLHATR